MHPVREESLGDILGSGSADHDNRGGFEMIQDKIKLLMQSGNLNIYLSGLGEWVLDYRKGGEKLNIVLPDLGSAIEQALNWVPLPVYPRLPLCDGESLYTIKKRSSGCWFIEKNGHHVASSLKTKREAVELVAKIVERNNRERSNWIHTYGPLVAGKAEGIDYRFA